MNNGYNPQQQPQQQPQYQPQPQQQQYQPQQQYYAPPKKPLEFGGIFKKLAFIGSLVFLALAGVAFLYYFIVGIVNATTANEYSYIVSGGSKFMVFLNSFTAGIYHMATYFFFSVVSFVLSKKI